MPNITPLRGLETPATTEEVESAARQYVRKVAGVSTAGQMAQRAIERSVRAVGTLDRKLVGSRFLAPARFHAAIRDL